MFGLLPTPETDPTIPLVDLGTGAVVARFDKKELAIALGTPDAANCPKCRALPRVILAR